MKKVLCFAAAALTLFAACQKTTVVYDNSEPQEIAVFAVNKTATKAPVSNNVYPTGYEMKVAAYLASGGLDANTASGDYFDGTLFKYDDSKWTGGKYWPMSTASINFLAVSTPPSEEPPYTGSVSSVTFGTGDETKHSFVKQASVVFENNQTTPAVAEVKDEIDNITTEAKAANYNQFDLMYAAGNQSHTEGQTYSDVSMAFKHALSWIKFTVATNLKNTDANDNTFSMTVNSIRLSGASYGGTLTVSTSETLTENLATSNYTAEWSEQSEGVEDVYVPGEPANDGTVSVATAVSDLSAHDATAKPFGNGLLVVPNTYATGSTPSVTINYTMNQGNGSYTFERTVNLPAVTWECNKIYTYALNINLTEISINPTVSTWEDYDADEDEDDNQPIEVNTNTIITES